MARTLRISRRAFLAASAAVLCRRLPAGRSRLAMLPRVVWISASTPNAALTTRSTRFATASTTSDYVEGPTITIHVRWGDGWLYAPMARRHMDLYGTTSRQFGEIAVATRRHAALHGNAIMTAPMTLEDHQTSRRSPTPSGCSPQ